MRAVFLTVSNMGLVSAYVILVVLLVRRLLSRFPKRYSYLLWSVVFLRLACPVGIESPFSLVPDALYADTALEGEEKITEMRAADPLLVQRAGNVPFAGEDGRRNNGADGAQAGNSGIVDADKESDKTGELEGAASGNNAGVSARKETGAQGSATGVPDRAEAGKQKEDANVPGGIGILTGTGRLVGERDAAGTKDTPVPGSPAEPENVQRPEGMTDGKDGSWLAGLAEKWGITDVRTGILSLLCVVWFAGILVFWAVWARTMRCFRKKLLGAVRVEEGVYETEQVAASFVDGIFRPAIYLATGLSGEARRYVLCHERVHIRRRDPLIKAAALSLVSIYWFHPLVWLAFKKMCEDMEMSCDERVVELLGAEIKKEYSSTLLQMAREADEISLLAAFGGNEVKSRVKNVLSYRRPKKGFAILLLVLVAAVGIGLGLNPGRRDAEASSGSKNEGAQGEAGNVEREAGNTGGKTEGNAGLSGQGSAGTPNGNDGGSAPGIDGDGQSEDGDRDLPNPDSLTVQYASVLNRYYIALEEKWDAEELDRTGLSILARYCYDGNALENVGYAFLDLDGDGKEELLIGAIAGDEFADRQVFQAYMMKDGKPWQIFSGWERSRYYLTKDEDGSYVFANEGSSGAGNSEWNYYRVLQDGTLSTIWKIVDDFGGITVAGGDAQTDEMSKITQEEAQAIIQAYEARYMKAEYSPFADFDIQDMDAWEDAWKLRQTALENQLNLILSKKELWEEEDFLYTVTDLDQNGRLELISASCQGTGIYTYSHIYEVSEDGTALSLCARTLRDEYDSQADIITSFTPVYKNPQTGQKSYIFLDLIRNGAIHYYESQWVWELQDGKLMERSLASMETEYDPAPAGMTEVTYAPGEFSDVRVTNAEEYMSAADRAFDGWQKGTARFCWFVLKDEAETGQTWYEKLEESYQGFSVDFDQSKVVWPQEEIEEKFLVEWKQKAAKQGIGEQEAADWYARFREQGMTVAKGDWVSEICFGDFDQNGTADCFFALNRNVAMDNVVWERKTGVEFWGSMNGEAFWHKGFQYADLDCIIAVSVTAGDVDHDGFTELFLEGDTRGARFYAFAIGQMLQYREAEIVERELPSDAGWADTMTSGYRVSVYETNQTQTCRAVLEQDGREVRFTVTGSREYASFLDEEMPGWRDGNEPFGGDGRGYVHFEIITQDGKDYLLAKEYLVPWAGSEYGQIGFACLLFDWDENGSAYVKDFYVEPF